MAEIENMRNVKKKNVWNGCGTEGHREKPSLDFY